MEEKNILISQGLLGSQQNGRFLNRRSARGSELVAHSEREVPEPNKKANYFKDPVISMAVLRTTNDE
jgi:hypothetical protein